MSSKDVNWGEAPHRLDTDLGSSLARMHVVLSSGRGCSQVLFRGILSRYVHLITLEVATWGGVGETGLY